jgi:hypothetical protein
MVGGRSREDFEEERSELLTGVRIKIIISEM